MIKFKDVVELYFEIGRVLLLCIAVVIAGAYLMFDINAVGLLMSAWGYGG